MDKDKKAKLEKLERETAVANDRARDNGGTGDPALGPAIQTARNAIAAGRSVPVYAAEFIRKHKGNLI